MGLYENLLDNNDHEFGEIYLKIAEYYDLCDDRENSEKY